MFFFGRGGGEGSLVLWCAEWKNRFLFFGFVFFYLLRLLFDCSFIQSFNFLNFFEE